ncbi:MAG: cation:proton antiporter [Treponema sp.]|jgi:Kef-type K+ transport system membrane component KefB/mannitol/fructose-specific phosphotransferase system IIA component (Ntr-type)|nr:cation:proton antiporter [Treponema sp.]
MHITELMAELVLQIGIVLFAVRLCGRLVKKIGIPSVLGELLAGVIIGPYALGGIALPGFPHGLFPLGTINSLAVSPELYAFATVASIILLFASGLETNIGLFIRYSAAGVAIGLGGVLVTFSAGVFCSSLLLGANLTDPRCLFMGVIAIPTSVGIAARIISEQKKMDSAEGVTMLAAMVFEDVPWIILLTVIMGIVAITGQAGGSVSAGIILAIAGKAFGVWLGVTVIGLLCSKFIASFLKVFKSTFDFSVLAIGLALILAGLFETQGLAMIIGAYIAGLSPSKTDIAAIIQERIRGLYEFFVPMFFCVMGTMVNVREIISVPVLIIGGIYTLVVILIKVFGCGGAALLLGFNHKGALRIGMGMIPRGEGSLITAGIGLAAGVISNQFFSIAILMILFTVIIAPPLFNMSLRIPGQGTKKPVKDGDSVQEVWEFKSPEIAGLVMNDLLKELRAGGFFVQTMNVHDGLSQARKGDIALFISEQGSTVTIKTSRADMPFVKNEIYEIILVLSDALHKLKASADPAEMKKSLLNLEARTTRDMFFLLEPENFSMALKGETKKEIITELVDILASTGRLRNRDQVLADVLEREESMSTGMEFGIALPHGKTDGVDDTAIAVGIKKPGINFDSMDGELSRLFVLIISPKKSSGLHVQFLAAIGAILGDDALREAVINAATPQEAVDLLLKMRN